jgi:hypothetical protein
MTDGPGEPLSGTPEGTTSPATPPAESGFARLAGALFSPDETFASIARRPDWLVPLLLYVLLSAAGGFAVARHVDFVTTMREQIEERSQGRMTSDQIDQQVKISASIAKVFAYCVPVVSIIVFVIVAAIMMLIYRMLGGEGTFGQYWSVTLYAWVPRVIQSVIVTIILFVRSTPVAAGDLPTLVRSNLAFLVDPHEHAVLFSLLSSFDVFSIWALVLMAIGMAYVSRFSKAKSATVLVSAWLIFTGLALIPAAIGAMVARK